MAEVKEAVLVGGGKYQAYPEYKESGSRWFKGLPSHWERILLKRVVLFVKDGTHGTFSRISEGKPLLSAKNVFSDGLRISESESQISLQDYAEIVKNGFPAKGDVLVTCVGTIGRAFVYDLDEPIAFQRSVAFLRLSDIANPLFYKYYIESKPYQSQLQSIVKSSAQGGVYMGDLIATESVLPPINEQRTIAAFLDYETARIDDLIAKQQRLIELLKEKRQAVISHAVTKGLNPDVPMKDSGVEWLGQVPEHWAVAKLGYRYEVLLGKMLDAKRISGAHLGHYLRNTDVQWGKINTQGLPQMDFRPDEAARYSVNRGDLLVCEGGEIGRAAVWQHDEPCFYQKALHRLRPYNSKTDLTGYFFYILFDAATQGRFDSGAGKATIAHLPAETFRQYRFAFPPYEEQIELEEHLREITEKYDRIESHGLKQISLLQERRTALISAAVTGKIDLRGWIQLEHTELD